MGTLRFAHIDESSPRLNSVSQNGGRIQNKPNMLYGFRQTRLGQLAAKKYGTVSAGLMRQYGTHLEKTRKFLFAVARL